jgi:phosphopantothenoylcysteine decarboxylase/phosphopantothenate--cysteine ligase
MSLAGRRVVLGISGGIAAYKSAYLARRLIEAGCEVRAVMTPVATEFIGTATLAGLTGNPVVSSLTRDATSVSPHTDLARWADAVVVAPATTATISRLAHGLSEDPVTATVIASTAPLVVAPAMHTEMWDHAATQRNIETLEGDGAVIVGPVTGDLAGGDVGRGRMEEPEAIVAAVDQVFRGPLTGTKVLVTAGGTREPIDPVRYIGNRSSGKMGHAIAEEAARRGATVMLVTTSPIPSSPPIERVQVETASEMNDAVGGSTPDIAVMAAAVADFTPVAPADHKLARRDGPPVVELGPSPDILAGVAGRGVRPFLVGFAAETGSLDRAVEKARNKDVDLLVANDVSEPGAGFGTDTNRVSIVTPDGSVDEWPMMPKPEVAARLWDLITELRARP